MAKKYTIEDFLIRAFEVHWDKYDYSKSYYENRDKKVEIFCKLHGPFFQSPNNHWKGQGCPTCKVLKLRMTQKEFIKKAKELHGNKFDYSKTIYIFSYKKVKIICPTHGSFLQKPSGHLQGDGCFKCSIDEMAKNNKLSTKDFIKKSKEVHGNKYNYNNIIYNGIRNQIEITCSEHGKFSQLPSSHLNGSGCPKCSNNKNIKLLTQEYILKIKEIYGNKYDLSKLKYNGANSRVVAICPTHGIFTKIASKFYLSGCLKCSKRPKIETKDFIKKARAVHTNKYDYSLVKYISMHKKINIRCFTHGFFLQTPSSHLNCRGCPKCAGKIKASLEEVKKKIIELLKLHPNLTAKLWKQLWEDGKIDRFYPRTIKIG